jgi:hypothetical protein
MSAPPFRLAARAARHLPPQGGKERRTGGISRREAAAFFFVVAIVAWLFGTFSRYPFDDEIYTLSVIQRFDYQTLLARFFWGYDVHPVLSYAFFGALWHAGFSPAAMRAASLLLTGIAFVLVLDLTLREIPTAIRWARPATVVLFATFPLIYGMGDALRWYPLLACLVAIFIWLNLRLGRPGIGSGVAAGLAASTNYLAIFAYLAFAVRRYGVLRKFSLKDDGAFHVATLITAIPGFFAFAWLVQQPANDGGHFSLASGFAGVRALGQVLLGFFGGYRLGLFHSAIVVPYLALMLLAIVTLARKLHASSGSMDLAALFSIFGVLAVCSVLYTLLTGHLEGRSYLFVAPFALSVLALGYWRSPFIAGSPLPLLFASLLLLGGVLANSKASDDPFKRDLVIPQDEVHQFILDNTKGQVLLASANPTNAYVMMNDGTCTVGSEIDAPACLRYGPEPFAYIVLVKNENFPGKPQLARIESYARQKRRLIASARFAHDGAAWLKQRLTGVRLDDWAASVEIYR